MTGGNPDPKPIGSLARTAVPATGLVMANGDVVLAGSITLPGDPGARPWAGRYTTAEA